MRTAPLESQIQATIITYLQMCKWHTIRMNSGGMVSESNGRRYMTRGAPPGTPDIFALKDGCSLFVEVKRRGNKPTAIQLEVMRELTAHGALCVVATCIEDVEAALRELRKESA